MPEQQHLACKRRSVTVASVLCTMGTHGRVEHNTGGGRASSRRLRHHKQIGFRWQREEERSGVDTSVLRENG